METIDVPDIQGLIVRGYGSLVAARYLTIKVARPDLARAWLGAVAAAVTPGRPEPAETAVNIAFTFSG